MRIILTLLILLISSTVYSDELQIPFSCWPSELKTEFAKTGRKLDLSSDIRSDDSWGYVINKGSEFVIYTYRAVTPEEFQIIQDIIFKIELSKREP